MLNHCLVVTASELEAAAVLAGLPSPDADRLGPYPVRRTVTPAGPVTVVVAGIGPAAAAAATATCLALHPGPGLTVSAGIAGGFAAAGVDVGDVVVATASAYADLGADSPDGFLPHAALGWGPECVPAPPAVVDAVRRRIAAAGLPVRSGLVLTLTTVTGTAARGEELSRRHGAVAEAMEGAAVATVAGRFGHPSVELRTVSNLVADRTRSSWEIPRALGVLTAACAATFAGELP